MKAFIAFPLFAVAGIALAAERQQDKIIISSEVPIPTVTQTQVVTATATETQVVTHVVAKPVQPRIDSYQLEEDQQLPAISEKTTLLSRYVFDITAPRFNYTTSGVGAGMAKAGAAMVAFAGAAAALV